jgi:hypothetical protein
LGLATSRDSCSQHGLVGCVDRFGDIVTAPSTATTSGPVTTRRWRLTRSHRGTPARGS